LYLAVYFRNNLYRILVHKKEDSRTYGQTDICARLNIK